MNVIWSKRALDRVEDIALYIAQNSVRAAVRWTVELFDEVDRLGEYPKSGKPGREVQTPGIREMVWRDNRVFYEVGSEVEILTVRHGRQRSTRTSSGETDRTIAST